METLNSAVNDISSFVWGPALIVFLLGTGVYCILIPLGSIIKLGLIWNLADITNGFMPIPNLVALLGLSGIVIKLSGNYDRGLRSSQRSHGKI